MSGSCARVFGQRGVIVELGHLDRRQRPVEDRDLVDQAVLEAAVAEPLADGELVATAAGDVLGQRVADDLALGPAAVLIEGQAAGPARAVVGQRDVDPLGRSGSAPWS